MAKLEACRQKLLDALSEGATVKQACKKAKCAESSFYRWVSEKSEFSEEVARAREAFAANCDREIQIAASDRIRDLLLNGETIVRTTKKVQKLGDGSVVSIVEERHTEKRGTPKWVFDKLMPDSLAEEIVKAGGQVHLHQHEGNGG